MKNNISMFLQQYQRHISNNDVNQYTWGENLGVIQIDNLSTPPATIINPTLNAGTEKNVLLTGTQSFDSRVPEPNRNVGMDYIGNQESEYWERQLEKIINTIHVIGTWFGARKVGTGIS